MRHFILRSVHYLLLILGGATGLHAQITSHFIVTDQFGYMPGSKKTAVIRDPQTGFDAAESFTPGAHYALVDKASRLPVFTGTAVAWKGGSTDASSGDKAWWFDFSAFTTPGTYYVLDIDRNVKSFDFDISQGVYTGVLRHAVRYFFYQRAGFAKDAKYAGAGWADEASHMGPLQDKNARPYNEKDNAAKEADLSGGWYDAGDYNRYTNWTANYIVDFLRTFMETPEIWDDNYNIPESGNGIPDLLDEAKWGVDHLLRLQKNDGSLLSILSVSHASPPSSAAGQSLYGTPNTSATLNAAGAFALASKVYGAQGLNDYALTLKQAAVKAWDWATANPKVIFKNNDAASGTAGIGAGQQETDDYGRQMAKLEAACFLYELTGETTYRNFVDAHYDSAHLIAWGGYADVFETSNNEILLYYAKLPGATPAVVSAINAAYKNGIGSAHNFLAHSNSTDPYQAYINYYGWGTNSTKSLQGLIFTDMITYSIDPTRNAEARDAAETYLHYLHGVNPLNIVYLSNMYQYGGDNCVNEFYHSWFANGSAKWDRIGTSVYGPPPGYLTGGANPTYTWDNCCPGGCGGSDNNSVCTSESLSPPQGQPDQKSYKDFNTSWPLNSWEVTENSNGYQINYIRLLAKFIQHGYDCSGTAGGSASFDACNKCSGGTTSISPSSDNSACENAITEVTGAGTDFDIYPNPSPGMLRIAPKNSDGYSVQVFNSVGKKILSSSYIGEAAIDLHEQPPGVYLIEIGHPGRKQFKKFIRL